MIKFELVKNARVEEDHIPQRATKGSSGYDFKSAVNQIIEPGEIAIIPTDIKAKMPENAELLISVRSSIGRKGIILVNAPGKIDSDYYGNPDNDGNIGFILMNVGKEPFVIKMGDRIGQGTFSNYLIVDDDVPASVNRNGGYGSTGK